MFKHLNLATSDRDLREHSISGHYAPTSNIVYVSDLLSFYWADFEPEKDILNHDKDI